MKHADPADRLSRKGWPERGPAPTHEYAPAVHDHQLQPGVRLALIALSVFVLLLSLGMIGVATYAYQDHEYVQGRGQVRDRENTDLNARITDEVRRLACQMLDGLPAGPLLDPMRAEYGCGPGLPLESLSPEAQQQLQRFADPPTQQLPAIKAAEPPVDRKTPRPDPLGTDAPDTQTVVPPPVAPVPPAAPTPGPPPTAPTAPAPAVPPLVDLTPLTDSACSLLGVCL